MKLQNQKRSLKTKRNRRRTKGNRSYQKTTERRIRRKERNTKKWGERITRTYQ
jgi:hypothetical protein